MGVRRKVAPDPPAAATEMLLEAGDVDAEVLNNLWRRQKLFPPANSASKAGKRLRIWGLLLSLAATYEAFVVPFVAAFDVGHNASFLAIGWTIDICCLVDIFLNFRTTFFTVEHELIGDTKAIAQRYLRGGTFALDALATLPLEIFAAATSHGLDSSVFKACRCNRLLRATRLRTVHADQTARLSRTRRLVIVWCCWLMLCHWSACVWWTLGNAQRGQPLYRGRRPWIERTPTGGTKLDDVHVPLAQAYWSCLYWSLTTLVKQVPWIGPETITELAYTTCLLVFGALGFAYLVGEVTAIVRKALFGYLHKSEMMGRMRTFCVTRHVPHALRRKVYAWVAAETELLMQHEGKARLLILPHKPRTELLNLIGSAVSEEQEARPFDPICAPIQAFASMPLLMLTALNPISSARRAALSRSPPPRSPVSS